MQKPSETSRLFFSFLSLFPEYLAPARAGSPLTVFLGWKLSQHLFNPPRRDEQSLGPR
jgi:hypothetical protein